MFGLICFLELPNILFTKYKKVFNPKKCSYQVHPIEIIINFAPEMEECWYVDKTANSLIEAYLGHLLMWIIERISFDNSKAFHYPKSYPLYQQSIIIIIEGIWKKILFPFKKDI